MFFMLFKDKLESIDHCGNISRHLGITSWGAKCQNYIKPGFTDLQIFAFDFFKFKFVKLSFTTLLPLL